MRRIFVLAIITVIWLSGCTERRDSQSSIQANSPWHVETVDSEGDVGYFPALALDSHGYPRISYFDGTNRDLKYAAWNGSSWDIEVIDSGGMGASLALDSSDYPHIAYYYGRSHRHLKYAAWNGSLWDIQTVDEAHFSDTSVSLVLDSSGNPHISYNHYQVGKLRYATRSASSWEAETVDSLHAGFGCSLALDSRGYPRISYDATHHGRRDKSWHYLKYAAWNGSSWDIQRVDKGDQDGLFTTSLALDSRDYPHIAYHQTDDGLKYAAWNGSSWDIQTVPSARAAGDVSLALDSSGHPHISYCDYPNYDLRYAAWNGSAWDIQIVDDRAVVGTENSLALDTNGYAHIAYRDQTSNSMNYATNRPLRNIVAVPRELSTRLVILN